MKFSLFTQLMLDTAESCWTVPWGKERKGGAPWGMGNGEWGEEKETELQPL